ncbi:MAG: hypothetical protein JSV05_02350 [Candidatus Bathyarchaeota archaeon]|nr:MAG: hypothetical protein JSV05_02350 [Candidatus Bathyarchaeota archaeon]
MVHFVPVVTTHGNFMEKGWYQWHQFGVIFGTNTGTDPGTSGDNNFSVCVQESMENGGFYGKKGGGDSCHQLSPAGDKQKGVVQHWNTKRYVKTENLA